MKKPDRNNQNERLVIILMIVVLVLGLIAGCFLVYYIPTQSSRETAEEKVKSLGENYSEYGLDPYDVGAVRTIIVDTEGNVQHFFLSTVEVELDPEAWPESWYLETIYKYLDSVLEGNVDARTSFAGKDGMLYVYTVTGAPILENGQVTGAVFMFKRDSTVVTALILFMIFFFIIWALIMLTYLLRKQKERRNAEMEFVKRQYVANVAHALKTPVTVTRVLAEAINDGIADDPDKQKEYCTQLIDECDKQEELIKNILKLSELQSIGRKFAKDDVLAEECFEEVFETYRDRSILKGIKLEVSGDFFDMPLLYTNAEHIKEVTDIILENAFKFTEKGSVRISREITGKLVRIHIKDSGPGISKRDLPLIFERFYSGKDIVNPAGNGLGLAIAKEILTGLGEDIKAYSENGAEFVFTIHLSQR